MSASAASPGHARPSRDETHVGGIAAPGANEPGDPLASAVPADSAAAPPSDYAHALLESAIDRFAEATRFPLVFGGFTVGDLTDVAHVRGNRTDSLDGLRVRTGRGLGGVTMAEHRIRVTSDYATSERITHDYDRHVLPERVRSLMSVPVIVDGRVRGVIYGALREPGEPGSLALRPAADAVRELERELARHDEIERRLASRTLVATSHEAARLSSAQVEELRESFVELRSIASAVTDPGVVERLERLEHRIAAIAGAEAGAIVPGGGLDGRDVDAPHLSRRELDVLGCVALGWTNRDTAASLGLTEGTVKSYLSSAMGKLESSTRHQAVVTARKFGLLP